MLDLEVKPLHFIIITNLRSYFNEKIDEVAKDMCILNCVNGYAQYRQIANMV